MQGCKRRFFVFSAAVCLFTGIGLAEPALPSVNSGIQVPGRWSIEKAAAWYAQQPWLVGCNYIPANAINQLEMWQADTFDPETINRELQWAEDLGFNTLRVYLHDLVWAEDPQGLYDRMDTFLDICRKHGMRPLFVFFDDCHRPYPKVGSQPLPVPEYHNSGWMNSPARDVAIQFYKGELSEKEIARLKGYVQETMRRFKDDDRVLMWELYNEPGRGIGKFGDKSAKLLLESWKWAREVNPSQPVCSCAEGSVGALNIRIGQENSDVISFHCYEPPAVLENLCRQYAAKGRPALCTEYMGRPKSTFEGSLPILKKYNIGAYNWGFVSGKTETIWHWSSREGKDINKLWAEGVAVHPGEPFPEPELWFHDIYRMDGTPYKQSEIDFIRKITGVNQN
jgi:hypothetical protein